MGAKKLSVEQDRKKQAKKLRKKAAKLDTEAAGLEQLAKETLMDRTRKHCLWKANQLRLEATRRMKDAELLDVLPDEQLDLPRLSKGQLVEQPEGPIVVDDEDFSEFGLPDDVKDLMGDYV